MKIAVFAQTVPWVSMGGQQLFAFEAAKNLAQRGHDVSLITLRHSPLRNEMRSGVNVIYAGVRLRTGLAVADCMLDSMTHFLSSHAGAGDDYDVRYIHKGVLFNGSRTPSVMHTWGEFFYWSPVTMANTAIDYYTAFGADRIIAASDFALRQYGRFKKLRDKATMIPPGTYTGRFKPSGAEKIKKRYGLGDSRVVTLVGRMNRRKGAEDMLDIARLVCRSNPDTKFLMVGRGEPGYIDYLKRKARNYGIAKNVVFAGGLPNEHLPAVYSASDIFALPSYEEGFGIVNIEAQSCSVPVVAYDEGGVGSSVAHGKSGFLVKLGDKRAFAGKVCALLEDERLRRGMGMHGRKWAVENFDWSVVTKKIEAVFREVV